MKKDKFWINKKLKEDKFYWLCSQTAEKKFDDYYTERVWLENWKKMLNNA